MSFESLKQEAAKAKSLDELFQLWKQAHLEEPSPENESDNTFIYFETHHRNNHYPPIEKSSFVSDGYISEYDYIKSNNKVLFVLREANIVMYRENDMSNPMDRNQRDFYFWYINDLKSNRPKQQEKMARMAYYLQHPELTEEERRTPDENSLKKALKSCGYMNINKRGGSSSLNWDLFDNYYKKYFEFIKRQIEIMSPNYIVLIGENKYELFNDKIKVWHTSYRMKGKKRFGTDYGSCKNVDCYMREFFERINKHEK